jgi:hypothetical protein
VNKKPLIVVSLCAVVLLVLGSQTNVIAYQTVKHKLSEQALTLKSIVKILRQKLSTIQIHQGTLTLKSLIRSPPQRQGIILSIYLIGLILIIPYLIFWASLVINPTPGFIISLILIGIFWPISLYLFFLLVSSDPFTLGKSLQNHQQTFSHILSLISPLMIRVIHA